MSETRLILLNNRKKTWPACLYTVTLDIAGSMSQKPKQKCLKTISVNKLTVWK